RGRHPGRGRTTHRCDLKPVLQRPCEGLRAVGPVDCPGPDRCPPLQGSGPCGGTALPGLRLARRLRPAFTCARFLGPRLCKPDRACASRTAPLQVGPRLCKSDCGRSAALSITTAVNVTWITKHFFDFIYEA